MVFIYTIAIKILLLYSLKEMGEVCCTYTGLNSWILGRVSNSDANNSCGRFKGGHDPSLTVATPSGMWLCSSSHQEMESVSPLLESWLNLWLTLAKRSDSVTALNQDFQRLCTLLSSPLVPCLAATWRSPGSGTSWRITKSSPPKSP